MVAGALRENVVNRVHVDEKKKDLRCYEENSNLIYKNEKTRKSESYRNISEKKSECVCLKLKIMRFLFCFEIHFSLFLLVYRNFFSCYFYEIIHCMHRKIFYPDSHDSRI